MQMSISKTRIFYIVFIVIAMCIMLFGIWMYRVVSFAVQAENTYHANNFVFCLVKEYIIDQKNWPDSWDDLEKLPSRQYSMYTWPKDRKKIQQCVSIDFNVTLTMLSDVSRENFVAIEPIEPCFSYDHTSEFTDLLDTIQMINKELSDIQF